MAAPSRKTLKDLAGKWTMDRKLSTDVDGVLQILKQGFSSLTRKAIGHAPVYLNVSQHEGQINIDQSTAAKIPAVKESWTLDWEFRDHKDAFMGKVKAKSRWSALEDVQGEDSGWLTGQGWLKEGDGEDGRQIEAFVEGDGWTAHQVWGFEEHQGQRRFVRRVAVRATTGQAHEQVKLVYAFDG